MNRTHQSVHFGVARARDRLRSKTLQSFGFNRGGQMQLCHASILTFLGEKDSIHER